MKSKRGKWVDVFLFNRMCQFDTELSIGTCKEIVAIPIQHRELDKNKSHIDSTILRQDDNSCEFAAGIAKIPNKRFLATVYGKIEPCLLEDTNFLSTVTLEAQVFIIYYY